MNKDCKNTIVQMYTAFTQAIDDKLIVNLTPRELTTIDNFVKTIGLNQGTTFLFNFFSYQFDYWIDKDTRVGRGRFPVGWIIGKKAFSRWKNRSDKDLYHSLKTTRQIGIKISQFHQKKSFDYINVKDFEELEKQKHFNTELGLSYCIETTTLYNHQSYFCDKCCFANCCKSMLKELLPRVMMQRGYLKKTTDDDFKIYKTTSSKERTESRISKFK